MTAKLTDPLIRRLEPPERGLRIVWDDTCRGFGIRTTANGAKSFVLHYRVHRRQRSITIGSFPDWSSGQAREAAQSLKRKIDGGEDPQGERQAANAAPTMADLAEHYRATHMPRKRSALGDERMLAKDVLPKLGNEKVADIERRDIAALHRAIAKRGAPYVANRVVGLLSKMFSIAKAEGWRTDNPCLGIEKFPEERRERYLSADELGRLMAALDKRPGSSSANVVRLLLLTGCRKSEALSAEWGHIDLVAGVWTKPSSHTKQKRIHRVPLGQAALELLARLRAEADQRIAAAKAAGRIPRIEPFVFPGIKRRGPPQSSIANFWTLICREAGLSNIRIHDLRHSYASILASSGASLPVIGRMLGHTQSATTQRYSHLLDQPLRDAADVVGRTVTSAKPQVVPIRPAAAGKLDRLFDATIDAVRSGKGGVKPAG